MKIESLPSYCLFACFSLALIFSSCAKDVFSEEESDSSSTSSGAAISPVGNCSLRLGTRSGDDNGAMVSYPVHIYIFNANAACVEKLTLETAADDLLKVDLTEGTYHICAIGGASESDYEIPSKESVKPNSVVRLKAGKRHGDIMYAYNVAILEDGVDERLTLSLKRRVLMLQDVVINNVPSGVTAVSVTIAPLNDGLCIDGEFAVDNGSNTVVLYRDGDTKVWRSSQQVYMYEAVEGATIKILMTDKDGTKGYSYSLTDELQANYKIRIEGTYAAEVGVTLSGTVIGDVWAGERVITFDMDKESDGGGTSGNTPSVGEAPEAGTIYDGCYVVSSEQQSDKSVRVVMMAPAGKNGIITDEDTSDESVEAAIEGAIKELAVAGIDNWRLPTMDEIAFVLDTKRYKEINKVLDDAGLKGSLSISRSYFYRDASGKICSYCGTPSAVEFNKGTYLWPFATVVFR